MNGFYYNYAFSIYSEELHENRPDTNLALQGATSKSEKPLDYFFLPQTNADAIATFYGILTDLHHFSPSDTIAHEVNITSQT